MTALAYIAGFATGVAITLTSLARHNAKRQRDRQAYSQHVAFIRAMSAPSTPRADRTP